MDKSSIRHRRPHPGDARPPWAAPRCRAAVGRATTRAVSRSLLLALGLVTAPARPAAGQEPSADRIARAASEAAGAQAAAASRGPYRAGALPALAGAAVPEPRPRRLTVRARIGYVASTALVRDEIAVTAPERPDARIQPVEAVPAPGPLLALVVEAPFAGSSRLEAAAGWTFADLRAREYGPSGRIIQELGIVHGILSLRHDLRRVHGRAGVGVIHYRTERTGIFADGAATHGVVEAAFGAGRAVGPVMVDLELFGQAHSFGTPQIRREGGLDGAVQRAGLAATLGFGGGTR
jgi:hypothetical protein